jgi:hypothetical protein
MGFMIGLLQWLLLRRHYSNSWIWLVGSLAGVAASSWLVAGTWLINRSGVFALFVAVLVYSAAAGLVLSRSLACGDKFEAGLV